MCEGGKVTGSPSRCPGRCPPWHLLTPSCLLFPVLVPFSLGTTVTELCNVACSSVMPGGGTNLELALHCLHEAQGSVQIALETLLLRGPQKPRTHPLADYRYTGDWSKAAGMLGPG
ncbi:Hypothetical predicted protein [Marmota monax]|uniref:ELM2 domain-containing protein n=1 Tax=Marmota monax TaxID=9995 RepID=A0A5E4BPG9_MARMO|nr:hypothetical protein GHT09_006869 [Marmota monax]VTJ70950.1 Hypothetical predicted protein [Marmota monax]